MGWLAAMALTAAGPAAARETIGVWRSWGAFRDHDRCYAIAGPASAGGASRWRPFASVARSIVAFISSPRPDFGRFGFQS